MSFNNHPFDNTFGSSLWHATKTPAGWVSQEVDFTGYENGWSSNIALDSLGIPRITYEIIHGPLGRLGTTGVPGDHDIRFAEPVIGAASVATARARGALP